MEPTKAFAGKRVVLIVENESVPFDRRMWNMARALRDLGATVDVICPVYAKDTDLSVVEQGITIYRYDTFFSDGTVSGYLREYTTAFFKTLILLHKILFRHKVHAVHVANPPDIFWPLALYLRLFGIRFLFDEHDLSPEAYLSRFTIDVKTPGLLYRAQQVFQKLSYRFAHTIIATNESYRENASRSDPRNGPKTFVVRNGPDLRLFQPRPTQDSLRRGKRFVAAYIGVMAVQDGVDYVVRAVDELVHRRNFTDFVTYLIGKGDEWNHLKQLASELKVEEYIVFTGRIPDEEALVILSTADVCLSPDPYNPLNELSTMTKIMEYMALEKPIVSFRLKENSYSAQDAALYVNNNDPLAFADGMLQLFQDPARCKAMGAAGRKRVEEALSWERQCENLRTAYTHLLFPEATAPFLLTAGEGSRAFFRDLIKPADDVPPVPIEREDMDHYLLERYSSDSVKILRTMYYALKPLMPRWLQIELRKRYAQSRESHGFPAWPIEPLFPKKIDGFFEAALRSDGVQNVHWIHYWPEGRKFAFVITHDVEWDQGLRDAPRIAQMEKRLGFTSSWNLVAKRYPIDWGIVNELRSEGFELGSHGIKHDGKLFASRKIFEERKAEMEDLAQKWNVVGFRSPSTLRKADWMRELKFQYDSSFPDTDPYEPHPGGCCTVWPYLLGTMVELPLTMAQDHTLFVILEQKDIHFWKEKASWLAAQSGLVLINIHPDYIVEDNRLEKYEEFLMWLKEQGGFWHALPKEVASWWRDRDASTLRNTGGRYVIEGPAAGRGTIVQTTLQNGILKHVMLK